MDPANSKDPDQTALEQSDPSLATNSNTFCHYTIKTHCTVKGTRQQVWAGLTPNRLNENEIEIFFFSLFNYFIYYIIPLMIIIFID